MNLVNELRQQQVLPRIGRKYLPSAERTVISTSWTLLLISMWQSTSINICLRKSGMDILKTQDEISPTGPGEKNQARCGFFWNLFNLQRGQNLPNFCH